MMNEFFRVPENIDGIKDGPQFNPKEHLQLEMPEKVYGLDEFGYRQDIIDQAPYPIAVTTPFRLLSESGLKALRDSIEALKVHRKNSERMANFIRGSAFYSPFIRDFCLNPEVNEHISKIAGVKVLPHPMALYQGHINLCPEEKGREVDRWHTDTVTLDYVLMVSDPTAYKGGHFEYFKCTKGQAIKAMIREESEPHIVKVEFPGAGMAILQQGNMVVHRASALTEGSERTTFVQSFIPDKVNFNDVSKLDDCKLVDPHDILYSEWARYKAFLSQRRLAKLCREIPYTEDKNKICLELRAAIRDVEEAILEISDPSSGRLIHLGQDALTDHL